MTVPLALLKKDSRSGTTVIPFPGTGGEHETSALHSSALTDHLAGVAELEQEFKTAFEAFVADTYLRLVLGRRIHADDPFDRVFISRLNPDPLLQITLDRIQGLRHIRDLSEQITFADGWDD